MPAGLIEQHDGMGAGRDQSADLFEMGLHRRGVAPGHDQAGRFALLGADRPEDVGGLGALVVRRAGSCTTTRPAPGQLVLLADAGFILEPDFELGAGAEAPFDPTQLGREVFLNLAMACGF